MGYRSEVRILTTIDGYKALEQFVKEYIESHVKNNEKFDSYNLLSQCDVKKQNDEVIYFGWNYVKWYEGDYIDVDAIMKGLEFLEENDYSFRYGRIGESYDDIEEMFYDSSEGENIDYPYIRREFDDDGFDYLEDVNKNLNQEKEEMEEM